jgi:hypothetical protein
MEDISMKAGFARLADSKPDKRHITVYNFAQNLT